MNAFVPVPLPGTATRQQRLERARSVMANALERYGADVVAIAIYGSTTRANEEPYSDLESIATRACAGTMPSCAGLHGNWPGTA
jgi:predicted nucleotidyltransferase